MEKETTDRLLALASLREQAERDAREFSAGCDVADRAAGRKPPPPDPATLAEAAGVFAALLADLTRWQSQAWALRRIGELLGWEVGDEVPQLGLMMELDRGNLWWITKVGQHYNFSDLRDLPVDRPSAIAAILLHLEASDVR